MTTDRAAQMFSLDNFKVLTYFVNAAHDTTSNPHQIPSGNNFFFLFYDNITEMREP